MKKTFQILGAAMLALAVVGCENDPIEEGNTPVTPDEPVVEEPAEPAELVLCATLPETRTTLTPEENGNGYKLEWSEGDGITVFQAEAGTTPESWTNYKFDIDEEVKGEFTPAKGVEVPFEEGKNYDWYVVYPYSTNNEEPTLKTPLGQSKDDGYFAIGATTQYGYNNTNHIAGMDIMVGKAKDTREPNVTLKHLAVLHKFTVTNNSDKPTVIQKLTVTGNTNIFGAFWIDLTADEPKIDLTKANNTADSFKTRGLTIKGALDEDGNELAAEELAVGASADFYMITAPFTLATGETFKVTITTSTGEQTLEKTATEDIEFKAGTYNTANLVYDYVYVEEAKPIFLETFGTSATYDKNNIIVYNDDVSGITVSAPSNGAAYQTSGYPTGGTITGACGRFSGAKVGSMFKYTGISVDGNNELEVSFDLVFTSETETKVNFAYKNTGGSWTKLLTTIPADQANIIQHITHNITVDGSKTIEIYLSNSTATQYIYVDNIKIDVPATE